MQIQLAPGRTPYDWNFALWGFPVRVSPFFWLGGLILGYGDGEPRGIVVWIVALLASILVHELGHALAIRHFGGSASIVLYHMGGLAIEAGPAYDWLPSRRRATRDSILIALAGPLAGFLLATAVALLIVVAGGEFHFRSPNLPGDATFWDFRLPEYISQFSIPEASTGVPRITVSPPYMLVADLFYINIFWGLLNLLPIYPLDGGQVLRETLEARMEHGGLSVAVQISCAVAAFMAVVSYLILQDSMLAFFFILMAGSNVYLWQQLRQSFE